MALKVEAKGGKGGQQWDDGSDFQDVTKTHVRGGLEGIQFIKFEYVKAGQTVVGHIHGVSGRGFTQTFEIKNLEKEILLSVEGYYNKSTGVIQSIQFNPPPPPSPSEKLQGKGGEGGDFWDDGAFQNVKRIYIGQGDDCIASVKFEYENDTSEVIVGKDHGKPTVLGYDEFELDHLNGEYIVAVEGCQDKIYGADETGVITMLRFKTNKERTSDQFGLESTSRFIFEKEGHKIVGFHGKASTLLHQIGVHVAQ